MPQTHDLGRLFFHAIQLDRHAPLVHRAITAEYDYPCRYSNSFVIRVPFRQDGIVIGWWRAARDEWSALMQAVRVGHEPDGDDEREFEDPHTGQGDRITVIDGPVGRVADAFNAGASGQ